MHNTEHTRRQLESMLSVEIQKGKDTGLRELITNHLYRLTEAENELKTVHDNLRKTIATCERFIREHKGE